MARTHGKQATYGVGCRCQPCTEANRQHKRSMRASASARLAVDPTVVEHGRASTYTNWLCRCRLCTDAHVRRLRELREKRVDKLAADPGATVHGRESTYVNWGCRCRPCTAAHATNRREHGHG